MDEATEAGARALVETAGARRLDEQRILRVGGDDARTWLNGQITASVGVARSGAASYALIVNLKGRVITDAWVLDRGDELDLVLDAALRDRIAEHLDRYVIMEDVTLAPVDDLVVLTVQGPRTEEVLDAAGVTGLSWPCDRLGTGGSDVVVPSDQAAVTFEAVRDATRAIGGEVVAEAAWELARVRLGVPKLGADFGEDTMPQEAGLGRRAVSFDKGCYVGQEAVVMLEHRGKPPKKLVQLAIDLGSSAPPRAGASILDLSGGDAGKLTSIVVDRPAHAIALGYLKRAAADEGGPFTVGGAPASIERVLAG